MKTKKLMMVALVSSTLALSGCGAMSTAIKKRNLEVKTQMSETIWLKPDGTVAKLAMRQPFVLFKGLTFQKLCL
ncbi:hypothetical protein ACR714_24510, partial [Salmonella enterica subsp. enterica serovar Dublin]